MGTKTFLEIDQEKAHRNQWSQRLTKPPKHYQRVCSSRRITSAGQGTIIFHLWSKSTQVKNTYF